MSGVESHAEYIQEFIPGLDVELPIEEPVNANIAPPEDQHSLSEAELKHREDWRRRHRSTFRMLWDAARTGKITENPSDEALDILMTRGFAGLNVLRSAEYYGPYRGSRVEPQVPDHSQMIDPS